GERRAVERTDFVAFDEHAATVGTEQPDDVAQRHALSSTAAAENDESGVRRNIKRYAVENLSGAEALRDVVETHGNHAHPPAACGNTKKINRTRTTFETMMRMEESTTARVEARPTPSVPDSVVKPRYAEIVA